MALDTRLQGHCKPIVPFGRVSEESMVTSQRYVDGAGAEVRSAAELKPLYGLLKRDNRLH